MKAVHISCSNVRMSFEWTSTLVPRLLFAELLVALWALTNELMPLHGHVLTLALHAAGVLIVLVEY